MAVTSHRRRANALVANALALMVSTVGSAALGLGFWVVAAHMFKPVNVGRASAEVAAITLIAGLGQLSLVSVFARFLPAAKRRTGLIVRLGYIGALATTSVLACGFVVLHFGGTFLARNVGSIAIFIASVLIFGVFALQDVVLTALRRARWVLTENILVAAVRLLMLPLMVGVGSGIGVLGAWAVPMVGAVAVVNWLAFRRLIPEKEAEGDDRGLLPTKAQMLNYGIAQYVNGVTGSVITLLPPVLVASTMGAQASAVFYLPWLFCTSCMALLWNIVFSLVVEAVHDFARTHHLLVRAAWLVAAVTCGGGLVLGFGAPLILSIVGSTYRDSGTVVLRLIALSLPFIGVTTLFEALSLIEKRTWLSVSVQGAGALIFIVGGVLSAPRYGLAGFGMAFLVSRVVAALASTPAIVLRYRALVEPDPALAEAIEIEAPVLASETALMYPIFLARGVARVPSAKVSAQRRAPMYGSAPRDVDMDATFIAPDGLSGKTDIDATFIAPNGLPTDIDMDATFVTPSRPHGNGDRS